MLFRNGAFSLAIAGLSICNLHAQEQLRWKFTPDTQRSMIMIYESSTSGIPGAASTTKTIMRASWNVDQVDANGSALIKQKILRVKTTMNLPGMDPIVHDTDAPAESLNPILAASIPAYKALIESELSFSMSHDGKVTEVQGTEAIEKATQAIAPAGMGAISGAKQVMESAAVMFPPSVQIGDTWEDQRSIKSPIGELTTTATYTYGGDITVGEKELKKIGMEIEISLEPDASSPAKMELTSSRGEGQLLFDNTDGYLVSQTMTTTIEMKVNDTIEMKTVQKMSVKTE